MAARQAMGVVSALAEQAKEVASEHIEAKDRRDNDAHVCHVGLGGPKVGRGYQLGWSGPCFSWAGEYII